MSSSQSPTTIRLIAIDIDGTLLGNDGRVSDRNLSALQAAASAGVEIVIATGRRHSYAMHVLRPLGLDPAGALISSNGAILRTLGSSAEPTQLIARRHIPHTTAHWMLEHLSEFRDALVLTFDRTGDDGEDTRGALVVERLEELHLSIDKWMTINAPYIAHIQPIEDALTSTAAPPIQAMLCGTVTRMDRAHAHLESQLLSHTEPLLNLHRTEYPNRDLSILDILPAGCSKGAALTEFALSRGIECSQILAIGDNWNDLPMFEIAGHQVLMDNAPEDLKALARARNWHIGAANIADGVAEAIESVLTTTAAY